MRLEDVLTIVYKAHPIKMIPKAIIKVVAIDWTVFVK